MLALRRRAQAGLLLVLLSGNALAASSDQAETELVKRVQEAKAAIAAAPDLKGKLAALDALKAYLAGAGDRVSAPNKAGKPQNRNLVQSIEGLRFYFDELATADLEAHRCGEIRARIDFDADPAHEPPQELPGEAREALAVLALVCR